VHFSRGIRVFGAFCSNFVGTGRQKPPPATPFTFGEINHDFRGNAMNVMTYKGYEALMQYDERVMNLRDLKRSRRSPIPGGSAFGVDPPMHVAGRRSGRE
jgi:hypothetical protein